MSELNGIFNIIQIKRGAKRPDKFLQPYEPGICTDDNNRLYIGGPLEDGNTGDAQDIKAGLAAGLILDASNYGSNFPGNPKEGQVFFKLLDE